MEVTNREKRRSGERGGGGGERLLCVGSAESSVQYTGGKNKTFVRFLSFFFTLERRLISRVQVDLGLHKGVTEQ